MKRRMTVIEWSIAGAIVITAITLAVMTGNLAFPGVHFGARHAASDHPKACEIFDEPTDALAPSTAQRIRYEETTAQMPATATHFGGQPSWLDKPQWPTSRMTGDQMRFVGQIAIDPAQFPRATGRVAYLFVADGGEELGDIWDPDAGENAVVIQPGTIGAMPVVARSTGPSESPTATYSVGLTAHADARLKSLDELTAEPDDEDDAYFQAIDGDKIGGTPAFIQGSEFPCKAHRLLYQVVNPPYDLNLGDGGSGFVFINETATIGKFLTQSF